MERFNELISLYLTDRLNPGEGAELAGLLKQPAYQAAFEKMVHGQLEKGEFDLEEPPASVYGRIHTWLEGKMEKMHELPVEEEKGLLRMRDWRRSVVFRWASVAAVLIFLGIGGYYFWTSRTSQGQLSQAQRFRNDLRPAIMGATMVLADGSQLALRDSLAQHGTAGGRKGMLHITTAKGETYSLVLADGTKVWLNAGSTLTYPAAFDGAERRVELAGEAFFDVRHDAHKPFSVQLKDEAVVKDIGTRFNVRAYPDEPGFRTTLVEGAAEMHAGLHKVLLKPGEAANYSRLKELTLDSTADLKSDVAWKDNLFVLDHASLWYVMSEIERWYNAKVVFDDAVKNDTTQFFGTLPRNVPVSQLLKILEATGHVHFAIEGNTITVIK